MNRRVFIQGTALAGAALGLGAGLPQAKPADKETELRLQDYLRAAYRGKTYSRTAPDTLNLSDRAELAINGLAGAVDPSLGYEMYFYVNLTCRTPYMQHGSADTTCDPKFAESFPMMRLMSGSSRFSDVEAGHRKAMLSRIQDGLYWNYYDTQRPWRTEHYNLENPASGRKDDLSNLAGDGRMLRALVTWRELHGDVAWDETIRELVGGLRKIASQEDDYSYYPDGGWGESFSYPRSGWSRTDRAKGEIEGTEGSVLAYQGHAIQGLARWSQISGDPDALNLAGRLSRYCMLPEFWGGTPDPKKPLPGGRYAVLPDPGCVAGQELGHWVGHFHAKAIALRGILEYGIAANDDRAIEFVRNSYEYSRSLAIPSIGWVNTHPVKNNLCEGCGLGDLVALAIRLSDARVGDYWDDVDAAARNQLIEGQLVRADVLENIAALSPSRDAQQLYGGDPTAQHVHPRQEISENVIQRVLGNYAGFSSPTSIPRPWVMQCCTGNGTQGLYYAWEGILREESGSAIVNLFLNRSGRSVDIDSYLPYQGRVVISVKTASRVAVRVPSWVDARQLRAQVAAAPRPLSWLGNYVIFEDIKPGDQIRLDFPIQETTARYTAASQTKDQATYTCTFRASTLVDISPRDDSPTSYPLYQRDHLRAPTAPLKTVNCFVAERSILRW
jgi:hypothetical protein